MSNRNIRIDSAEQPDYVPNPQHDPIGYDSGRRSAPTQRRSRMPFGVFLLASLAALLIVGFVCWQITGWVKSEYMYNATFSWLAQLVLYMIMLSIGIAAAVSLLSLAFGLFGWSLKRHLAELPGGVPVAALDVVTGWQRDNAANMASGMMNRHFDVQDRLAANSQFRNVTAFSPSTNYSYSAKQDAAQLGNEGTRAPLLPPGDVPPFDSLLAAGMIGPDPDGRAQPLIFGYDAGTGEPLTGDFKMLYSSGLGGLQGSGKTWTAAYLLAQSALSGAQIMVCDIHAGDSESLASRVQPLAPSFVCDIADDEQSVLEALKYAESVLKARKAGDSDRRPLIVAVDEFSALRRGALADKLPSIIESFSTEGRKLQCHVMLMAQRWDKSSVGSFRNTLASSFVHRLRADEARMLTGLRAELLPKDTLQLPPGHAYLLDTYGLIHRVAIPRMSMASMQAVGERLGTSNPTSNGTSNSRQMGFQPPHEVRSEVQSEVNKSPTSTAEKRLSVKALQVRDLLRQKKSQSEIIEAVWGITGGGAYKQAVEEYRAILAELAALVQ